jgi:eukaryotic-like serine/threonine-protein kinase
MREGQVIGGKYRLMRRIGSGGMSEVWEAMHAGLERRVAVKILNAHSSARPEVVKRFAREARLLERVRHPNVVHVHDVGVDVGVDGGQAYLVMELLDGADLAHVLAARPRLSFGEAWAIFDPVLSALAAAHANGVVHRDIKPANLFLTREPAGEGGPPPPSLMGAGAGGREALGAGPAGAASSPVAVVMKVLDFGIAKIEAALAPDLESTAVGTLMGTPLFMSPEQVNSQHDLDHRSDLWSLGVVMYLALTGEHPFASGGEMVIGKLLTAILTRPPPAPSSFAGHGASADDFFARALSKDPTSRFESAAEMREAFGALVEAAETSGAAGALVEPRGGRAQRVLVELLAEAEAKREREATADAEAARASPVGALASTASGSFAGGPRAGPLATSGVPAPSASRTSSDWKVMPRPGSAPKLALPPGPVAGRPPVSERPPLALKPGAWSGLAELLPPGLGGDAGAIGRFLGALFGRYEPESERVVRLFDRAFEAAEHYEFYAVFLSSSARAGLLATQTFIAQSSSLEQHLARLGEGAAGGARALKVVLALSDSTELGVGVRQRIGEFARDYGAYVVPLHVARVRAAVDAGRVPETFREWLVEFLSRPNVFAAAKHVADPTSLFGHLRSLIGELVRELERPALVSVWGPPGCGKSSLVELARGELADTHFVILRGVELPSPLAEAARAIARALGDEGPPEAGVRGRIEAAARAAHAGAGKRRVLLVLEDADVLLRPLSAGDEAERADARGLWAALGRACGEGLLSVVVTSLSGFVLDEVKVGGWANPLAGRVRLLRIPPLAPGDVRKMLVELGVQGNVRFDDPALAYAHEVSAGNVYALRRLCSHAVDEARRAGERGPLDEVRVGRRDLVASARHLAAVGETFNATVLPWLDETERLVLEAVAVRRPKSVRDVQGVLAELDPAAVAAALDRLRRIGFVERRDKRERVATPLLEEWSRHNLRPAPGEAARRRERQNRRLAWGVATPLVLLGGYGLWSWPGQASWDAGGCRYQLDYPARTARGAEIKLYAFRTCEGPPGGDDVRLSARAGTLARLGEAKGPQFVLQGEGVREWQQQEIAAVLDGLGRSRFELDVLVAGRPRTRLSVGYDWLAGVPELAKKLIAAASVLPAVLLAFLNYGNELLATVKRVLGREGKGP